MTFYIISPDKNLFKVRNNIQKNVFWVGRRASGLREAVSSLFWLSLVIASSLRFNCKTSIFIFIFLFFFTFFSLFILTPLGSRYRGESAASDGERAHGPGQGWGAGLCLAGEPQQRGSLHREPPPALQGKPRLCNKAHFFHNIFAKTSTVGVRNFKCVVFMFWLRHTLALCWCQWTLTKSWGFTPNSRWSATEGSASMRYLHTCKSSHTPTPHFFPSSLLLSLVYSKRQPISYYVMWSIRLFSQA